jgi:catechol 2,3-dioxygenase-like lactoylglutathione lyase family enzyme
MIWVAAAAADEWQPMRSKFELFVSDTTPSANFYQTLGFRVVEQKPGGYTTLRNRDVVVSLSPHGLPIPTRWFWFLRHPPLGTEIVLYVADLETNRDALSQAGYEPGSIEMQPWGLRDFRVFDPEGYYVRVTEGVPAGSDE